MASTPYDGTHRRLRLLVLARDHYRCHWCGGVATEADHLTEVAKGGTNTLDNYVASCGPCNHARGGRLGGQTSRRLPTSRRW
jgi:5-methylcytosine-specific restriction endonuclease McrA